MRVAVLPEVLRPVDGVALIRVGPASDGGYTVSREALDSSRRLLSMGLGDDWRFEQDFQARTGAPVTVVDHTVTTRFWINHELRRITNALQVASQQSAATFNRSASLRAYRKFFADPSRTHLKFPVGYGGEGTLSLSELLDDSPPAATFVKMDIEGHEWRTTDDLLACQDRLTGLAVEFHNVDLHLPRLLRLVERLDQMAIVDIAINNYGIIAPDRTPALVEMSFARRDHLQPDGDHWGYAPSTNVDYRPPVMLEFE